MTGGAIQMFREGKWDGQLKCQFIQPQKKPTKMCSIWTECGEKLKPSFLIFSKQKPAGDLIKI